MALAAPGFALPLPARASLPCTAAVSPVGRVARAGRSGCAGGTA